MAPQLPLYQPGDANNQTIFWQALSADEIPARVFPTEKSHRENKAFALSGGGAQMLHPAAGDVAQGAEVFTYYIYGDQGERQFAVTDWAVEQFREHYVDVTICQSDIFYYSYAVLHHPAYQAEGDAASLMIPMADAFWAFSDAGRALTAVHLFPGDDADVETARIAGGLPGLI